VIGATPTQRRGGHFPGHIRETFLEAIEAYCDWNSGEPEPIVTLEVNYEPRPITISAACGLLWNCADILPYRTVQQLEDTGLAIGRRSYAGAARAMRERICRRLSEQSAK
jgi:hypothetical protein